MSVIKNERAAVAVCKNSGCSTNRNEQRWTAGKEAKAGRVNTGGRLEDTLHSNRNGVVYVVFTGGQGDDHRCALMS